MTTRRIGPLVAFGALVGGLVLVAPTGAGGQEPPCEQPYSPVAFAQVVPDGEDLPAVAGEVVSRRLPYSSSFDSDGDGARDVVELQQGGGLRITRGDGVIELTVPPGSGTSEFRVGDIDGDGGDEFGATVNDGTSETTYLLPSATAPGTYAIGGAGITFGSRTNGAHLVADGSDRLLVFRGASVPGGDEGTDVYDASDVLALGPGSDATTVSPIIAVTEMLFFAADLGGPDEVLVGRGALVDSSTSVQLAVVDGTEVTRLVTTPEPFSVGSLWIFEVSVVHGPQGTFVRLDRETERELVRRSESYLWSLDDPCTVLVDPDDTTTTTTTGLRGPDRPGGAGAAPATPIVAPAAFAG